MRTLKWEKVYKGPFSKKEAQDIAGDLRKTADPQKNLIYDARIRARKKSKSQCVCTAACGAGLGHNEKFDVYIKTTRSPQDIGEGISTVKEVSA